MIIDNKSIGSRIRYHRIQNGLSQEELAERTDVSFVYISHIERGEKSPSLKTIIAISNALEVSVDDLIIDNLSFGSTKKDYDLFNIIGDCTREEKDIIVKNISSLKEIIRQYHITK